jgi:hypothetical protein
LRQSRLDNVSRLPITNEFGDPRNKRNSEVNSPHHQIEETNKTQDDNTTKPEPKKTTSSLMNLQQHKLISRRRKVELSKIYNDRLLRNCLEVFYYCYYKTYCNTLKELTKDVVYQGFILWTYVKVPNHVKP